MHYTVRIARGFSLFWLLCLIMGSVLVRFGVFGSIDAVNVNEIFVTPNLTHWMGTDSMGRDFLLRIMQGSGISLAIAAQSILISLVIAIIYGGFSGWGSRRLDTILMMGLDVWMSLPSSVLAALVGLLLIHQSDSILVVSFVIGSTHWGRLARLVRGEVLRLREKSFIKAAEALGASGFEILGSHFIPHLSSVVGIYVLYQIPNLILAESFLSFIGLGVQAPETSWGILLQDGWRSLQVYPHVVFFPAVFLFLTVLSLNSVLVKNEGS